MNVTARRSSLRRWRQQSGQGLLEILLVCLIVAIASVSLLQFQAGLAYRDSLALQRSDATILALSQIESLRDFQVLSTQAPYMAYSAIASGIAITSGANASYTITWTVTPFTAPTYKVLDVSVTWNDLRGKAQTIRLTSNIAGIEPVFSATILY